MKKELSILLVAAGAGLAFCWWKQLPPFQSDSAGEYIELAIDNTKSFPSKVPFRFGSRALAGICDEYSLDEAKLIQQMEALGIKAKSEWAIKRIAEENDMEVEAVFDVIQQQQ